MPMTNEQMDAVGRACTDALMAAIPEDATVEEINHLHLAAIRHFSFVCLRVGIPLTHITAAHTEGLTIAMTGAESHD